MSKQNRPKSINDRIKENFGKQDEFSSNNQRVDPLLDCEICEEDLIKLMFEKFDNTKDGKIDKDDLFFALKEFSKKKEYPSHFACSKLVKQIGPGDSGKISYYDFKSFIEKRIEGSSPICELKVVFDIIDVDNDGLISCEDFLGILNLVGEKIEKENDIEEIISKFDFDNDLHLNFNEFCNMVIEYF